MSWFGRGTKNRRHGRGQHVLDVKLRSDQVRATRLRWAAIGLATVVATMGGFFALWHAGAWALDVLVYRNQAFAVERIDVQTDGVIAPDQLRRWSGVKPGNNLLALDLARVKRNLELAPAIRSAAVERVMPHTLRLRVSEREPVAQVSVLRLKPDGTAEPSVVWLDREAFVMTTLDPRLRATPLTGNNSNLPAICGINLNEVAPGKKIDSEQVRAALGLISAFQHSPMAGLADLQRIDVSSLAILQVTTGDQEKIVFASDDPETQLRWWRDIRDRAQQKGKTISTLDLSVRGNIPAVLIDAAVTPPPADPKNPNPPTLRKKNV